MRRIKPVIIGAHPSFYEKMEVIRKMYKEKGISLSQIQLTDLIAKRIRTPKIPNFNLRGKNDKKKRRPY